MKNNVKIGIGVLALTFGLILTSCMKDPVDAYYNKESIIHDGNVMRYLESHPEYSTFVTLLRETKADTLIDNLSSNLTVPWGDKNENLVTVFAFTNEAFESSGVDLSSMTAGEKRLMADNHISSSILSTQSFSRLDGKNLLTCADKYLAIQKAGGGYTIDGIQITPNSNHRYANGIIHELNGVLSPRPSLIEFVKNLPDAYSIYRDSIRNHDREIYDTLNNLIIGFDDNGKSIYDPNGSTKWENDYLDAANIRDENGRYTVFIPSDQAIRDMIVSYRNFFDNCNRPYTELDEAVWMDWLIRASLFSEVVDPIANDSLVAANGNNLKMRKHNASDGSSEELQHIAQKQLLSNGVAYLLDKCYVPHNIYYDTVVVDPYALRMTTKKNDTNTGQPGTPNDCLPKPVWDPAEKIKDAVNTSIDFYVGMIDRWTSIATAQSQIFDGTYQVRFQFNKDGTSPAGSNIGGGLQPTFFGPGGIGSSAEFPTYQIYSCAVDYEGGVRENAVYTNARKVSMMPGCYTIYARLGNTRAKDGSYCMTDTVNFIVNDQIIPVYGITTTYVQNGRTLRSPLTRTDTYKDLSGTRDWDGHPAQPSLCIYDYQVQGGVIAANIEIGGDYAPFDIRIEVPNPREDGPESSVSYRRLTIGRITFIPTDNY